jgi:hypothetical protein
MELVWCCCMCGHNKAWFHVIIWLQMNMSCMRKLDGYNVLSANQLHHETFKVLQSINLQQPFINFDSEISSKLLKLF